MVHNSRLHKLMSDLIRQETFEGRPYLVAPVILMVEGVHNDCLYTAEELQKYTDAWNGSPLPVFHPNDNGDAVTANSPEVLEDQCVGVVFNAFWDEDLKALKAEAWIDVAKADEVDETIMEILNANKMMEVSTGLFVDEIKESGDWNGEHYDVIAVNYRPDHLALLPGGKGACSVTDGAGLPRINQEEGEDMKPADIIKVLKTLGFVTQEMSFDDTYAAVRDVLRASLNLGNDDFVWVRDLYDNHVVYAHESNDGTKLYDQGYAMDANEQVTLVGARVEVIQETSYKPVVAVNQNTDKENTRGNEDMKKTKEERIAALVAGSEDWGEEDTGMLTGLSDKQFDGIEATILEAEETVVVPPVVPVVPPVAPVVPETEVELNEDGTPKVNASPTFESLLAAADPDVQASFNHGIKTYNDQKAALVAGLKANDRCDFSEEELNTKEVPELTRLAKMCDVEPTYDGQNPVITDNEEDKVPDMPAMAWDKGNG